MKRILYFSIILFLLFPAIQKQSHLFNSPLLNGAFYPAKNIKLSIHRWFNNEFQDKKEKYIKDHMGFRSHLVLLNNQIDYSFFSISHAKDVVVGSENILYQDYYIDAYYGHDYVGDKTIRENTKQFSKVQKLLHDKGIELVLAITPSKATFYPNNFPSHLISETSKQTNYKQTILELEKLNCNYIDLKEILLGKQKQVVYPIFPKQGIHWSGYGATLAADTLFKYISSIANINLNIPKIEKGILTTEYQGTDYDIGESQNLIFNYNEQKLYYPKIVFNSDFKHKKTEALIIGDSFTNSFFNFYPFFQNIFSPKSQFWYYNQEVHWPEKLLGTKVQSLNLHEAIKSKKIILLITSEHNIKNLGFGFTTNNFNILKKTDSLYIYLVKHYFDKIKNNETWSKSIKEKNSNSKKSLDELVNLDAKWMAKNYLVNCYKDSILMNRDWFTKTQKKAVNNNISIDKMIEIDANYIVNQKIHSSENKMQTYTKKIQSIIHEIKSSPDWYKQVKEKALKTNRTVEQQLEIDAKWMISRQ